MKNLVIYYSYTGNTEIVAREIARTAGADIIRIEEEKERTPRGFGAAAMAALFGIKSRLKPMDFPLQQYDNIFLGTPVWASRTTPAINTILSRINFTGKKVWFFATLADDKKPEAVINSAKKKIEKRGGIFGGCVWVQTKMNEVVSSQYAAGKTAEWVKAAVGE